MGVMKTTITARPRVAALLMAAAAFPATVWAQEAAPPPVAPTATTPAPVPAPAPETPPVAARPAPTLVQPTPERPVYTPEQIAESEASLRRTERRAPRAAVRPAPDVRTVTPAAPAAAAAAPVVAPAEPTSAPVAAAPVETPAPPPVVAEDLPAAPTGAPTTDAPIVPDAGAATTPWSWIVGGLVALAAVIGLLALMRRRRRNNDAYEAEPVTQPVAARQPVSRAPQAAAPKLVQAAEGVPPGRPWLRMTLQPTGVEPIGDGNTLFYDLIVENEGSVPARDVRVSSFLFGGTQSSGNERSLIVPVGASRPVSASVALPAGGSAKVVADIRYPLPDGTEGHVAARFAIDTTGDVLEAKVDRVLERI
jgi:hypothetical protein